MGEFRKAMEEERERREQEGIGDRWMMYQRTSQPSFDNFPKNFKIEMLFECGEDGEKFNDWFSGRVTRIVKKERRVVEIEWDNVAEGDKNRTQHVLFKQKWNPERPGVGAW